MLTQNSQYVIRQNLKSPVNGYKSSFIEVKFNYASDKKCIVGMIYRHAPLNF